jgi:hypothetical protein
MKNKPHQDMLQSIPRFIKRINLVLYIVLLGCGLIAYVIILDNILQNATGGNSSNSNASTTIFDQSTIDKISQLKPSSNNSNHNLPAGRINPFSE